MKKYLALLLLPLLSACQSSQPAPEPTLLDEVKADIQEKFYGLDEIDPVHLMEEQVRGYVEGLGDEHTEYYTPEEATALTDSLEGTVSGIGAVLNKEDDRVIVKKPLESSPSERSGMQIGDVILAVDDTVVSGMSIIDVVDMIHGEEGTNVDITVLRPKTDEVIDFIVTRAVIELDSVELDWEGDIAVLTVNSFDEDTSDEFFDNLESIYENENLQGIIIDLRYNGGGYVSDAAEMTSFFLPTGEKIVDILDKSGEVVDDISSIGILHDTDVPLVVLVNSMSASASEIMSGALKDNGRATIVGEQTYGKGSVQEVVRLSDGGILKVTIAHWFTPNGTSIEKEGITPDYIVDYTLDDYEAGLDPQMAKALEVIQEKS